MSEASSRYRIGALLYFADSEGRVLLIQRRKQPNLGLWCAVGGKLEMPAGESPFECAVREAKEEVGVDLSAEDLALRCILAEKDYEATGHWLMFVFEVVKALQALPVGIEEGCFRFFEPEELGELAMPEMDRCILLERILGDSPDSLHVLRAERGAARDPGLLIEEERIGEVEP